ncbi:hypothetical protein [Brucella intermedia]|uniref:hypothetical protein n=1 Tax=Brucella intermedia TaxID=94625 RepID=UPI0034CDD6C0
MVDLVQVEEMDDREAPVTTQRYHAAGTRRDHGRGDAPDFSQDQTCSSVFAEPMSKFATNAWPSHVRSHQRIPIRVFVDRTSFRMRIRAVSMVSMCMLRVVHERMVLIRKNWQEMCPLNRLISIEIATRFRTCIGLNPATAPPIASAGGRPPVAVMAI